MKNIIIGIMLTVSMATGALAQTDTKTYVETDGCVVASTVVDQITEAIPDAVPKSFGDTVVFSSPSREGNLVVYFDDKGCYYAFEIINASAA